MGCIGAHATSSVQNVELDEEEIFRLDPYCERGCSGFTSMLSTTCVTPGVAHAASRVALRSAVEDNVPVSVIKNVHDCRWACCLGARQGTTALLVNVVSKLKKEQFLASLAGNL